MNRFYFSPDEEPTDAIGVIGTEGARDVIMATAGQPVHIGGIVTDDDTGEDCMTADTPLSGAALKLAAAVLDRETGIVLEAWDLELGEVPPIRMTFDAVNSEYRFGEEDGQGFTVESHHDPVVIRYAGRLSWIPRHMFHEFFRPLPEPF